MIKTLIRTFWFVIMDLLVVRMIQKTWNWLTPPGWWQIDHYWPFVGVATIFGVLMVLWFNLKD